MLPVKSSGGKLYRLHSLVRQDQFVSKLAKDKSKGGPGDSYEGWAVERFCKPLDDRVDVCAFRGAYIDRTFQIGLEEEGQGSGFVGSSGPLRRVGSLHLEQGAPDQRPGEVQPRVVLSGCAAQPLPPGPTRPLPPRGLPREREGDRR